MKNKVIFIVGTICLVIVMAIASYLWYIYFGEYENKIIAENKGLEFIRGVELINSGSINYVNATVLDTEEVIPTYYFRVKNNADKDFNYEVFLENSNEDDGCTESTRFKREDLQYELKLDNRVIKTGILSELKNDLLDSNVIKGKSINDYSIRIWLNDDLTDYENKHFHYIITLKEKE